MKTLIHFRIWGKSSRKSFSLVYPSWIQSGFDRRACARTLLALYRAVRGNKKRIPSFVPEDSLYLNLLDILLQHPEAYG